jgi:hypothetical protein
LNQRVKRLGDFTSFLEFNFGWTAGGVPQNIHFVFSVRIFPVFFKFALSQVFHFVSFEPSG